MFLVVWMRLGLEIKGTRLMLNKLKNAWKNIRQNIRQLSGDDAYERYLAHYAEFHAVEANDGNIEPALSREAFFKEWQTSKWKGIKRCC